MSLPLLIALFLIIAIVYASVGFGGGSSYIAILLMTDLAIDEVRFTALVCNLVVVSASSYYFYHADLLKVKHIVPLVILSIPLAFLGGSITLDPDLYRRIAAIALLCAAGLILIDLKALHISHRSSPLLSAVSGGIGFLSGMIGIGGGIFLSPALHLTRWDTARVISAMATVFILVNSVAGLMGQLITRPQIQWDSTIILAVTVFVGGRLGNKLNIHTLDSKKIRIITATLITIVAVRILIQT